MNKIKNTKLTSISRVLRTNMTKEERHLWYDFLKKLPYNINRQKVIERYIVDFYCAEAKIAIELDGSQHLEKESRKKDSERDSYLNGLGISVLRYSNLDVNKNFRYICEDILRHIEDNIQKASPPGGSSRRSRVMRGATHRQLFAPHPWQLVAYTFTPKGKADI